MNIYLALLLVIISYLLGSIPHALIVSKLTMGIDIREHGSKNMGATNTLRVLGVKWGLIVLFLDALKAAIVVAVVNYNLFGIRELVFHPLIYGIFAILGHLYPVFCKFKGGKGVACACGLLLGFNPLGCLVALTGFTLALLITKYVSAGSLTAAVSATLYALIRMIINYNFDFLLLFIICLCLTILLFIKHIPNLKRIANKTETKITDMIKK